MQNAQYRPCWAGSRGAGSSTGIAPSGRFPRPGTVQTSVPLNGLTCFTVPSAIRSTYLGGAKNGPELDM